MNAIVIAGLALGSTVPGVLKCGGLPNTFPGYEADEPVVVVDDHVLPASAGLEEIGSLDVGSVTILCWNPENGELGIGPGIPLVRIITMGASRDLAAPALGAVHAQSAAYRETGRFLESLDDLDLPETSDVTLDLESDGATWTLVVQARFRWCEVSSDLPTDITAAQLEYEACHMRSEELGEALRDAYEAAPTNVVGPSGHR